MEWVAVKYGDRVLAGMLWGKVNISLPSAGKVFENKNDHNSVFSIMRRGYDPQALCERKGCPQSWNQADTVPEEIEQRSHGEWSQAGRCPEQASQNVLAQKSTMRMKFSPPGTAAVLVFSPVRVKAGVSWASTRSSPEHNMILRWGGCETRIKSPWQTVWVCARWCQSLRRKREKEDFCVKKPLGLKFPLGPSSNSLAKRWFGKTLITPN